MPPKVSVCLRTFNQLEFVRQAIESILSQRTSFDFELVVGDDCSSDGTAQVILNYQKHYPDVVRPLPSTSRLGGKKNMVRTIQESRGEYVAMLDGDDFWTSEAKLQRQADLLDLDPRLSACGHQHEILNEDRGSTRITPQQSEYATLREFLAPGNLNGDARFEMGHLTVMARRTAISEFPEWFYKVPLGDKGFQLLCGLSGDYGFINDEMASYRKHAGAEWSVRGLAEKLEGHVFLLESSRAWTQGFESEVNSRLMRLCTRIAYLYRSHDTSRAHEYSAKAAKYASSSLQLAGLRSSVTLRNQLLRIRRHGRRVMDNR